MWSQILGTVWTDNIYAENAIPFFDKAIALLGSNSPFTTIPRYYRVYTQIIQEDGMDLERKIEIATLLRSLERGFRSLIAEECSQVSVVSSISLRLHEIQSFIQVESFKEQRKNIIALYQLFIDSIHDILGSVLLSTQLQTLTISSQEQISELMTQLSEGQLIQNCSVIDLPPCNNDAVPGGVTNSLVYRYINPDIQILEKIAVSYGIPCSELHEMVYAFREECEEKLDMSNQEIHYFFQHRLRLPTRDEFWEALVSSGIVSSLKTVGIIADNSAKKLVSDPVFKKLQKERKIGDIFGMDVAGQLFYSNLPHSSQHIPSRYPAISIPVSYMDAVNNEDFRDLVTRGLLAQLNQYGKWVGGKLNEELHPLQKLLEHGPGYLLKFDYTLKILASRGVPIDYLDYNLFYYLEFKGVLTKQGLLLHTNFEEVDWGKYAFFKDEIISVFQLHCIYRYDMARFRSCLIRSERLNIKCILFYCRVYALNLEKEITIERSQTGANLSFINPDPCSSLINELFYSGILRRNRVVAVGPPTGSVLQANFKSALENFELLTKEDVTKLFKRAHITLKGSVEAFMFYLVSKDWLRVSEVGHVDEIPTIGKINLPKKFKPEDLDHPWNTPEIKNFLIVRGALVHEKFSILQSLEQFTGRLSLIDKPDGSLLKIETKLSKPATQRMISEIVAIQSMGLDSIMVIFDRNWSVGRIGKASSSVPVSCASSGYLQIAAGIAISVYSVGFGAFSGQTLIDQGISDMSCSLMSTFSENLAWEGYWTRRCMSSNISSLMSMISPAVSVYLGGPSGLGSKIVCKSAANGKQIKAYNGISK